MQERHTLGFILGKPVIFEANIRKPPEKSTFPAAFEYRKTLSL